MSSGSGSNKKTTRLILDPPTFSPSREMCAEYLAKRKSEVGDMLDSAREGEWKPVMTIANHVRGTGAMYGFPGIGDAAEALVKAVQNGYANSDSYLEAYVGKVNDQSDAEK